MYNTQKAQPVPSFCYAKRSFELEQTDRGQKVEVILNHQGEMGGEISLARVFSNMAKKKKIYLRVLAILLILGLILPMLAAEINTKAPSTQAVVQLKYTQIDPETGKDADPQPIRFSSYVLQEALNNTQLSTAVSITNVESNLKVEQLLTAETRQRLEILERQIAASASTVAQATSITLNYDNTFIITLANGFGAADSANKTYLTTAEIQDLLNNIIKSYNNQLYKNLSDFVLPKSDMASLKSNDLDFLENLDIIKSSISALKDYCDARAVQYPDYRSPRTGLSFADLSDTISTINDIDISYLYSYIMYNGITKDQPSLINKYNYTLRTAKLDLADVNSRIEGNNQIIENYKNQSIHVIGGEEQSSRQLSITTEYYNNLVLSQTELFDKKSQLESQIADLENRIKVFDGTASSKEVEAVRKEYERVYEDAMSVQELVLTQAEELLASDTIRNSYLTATTAQSRSSGFFSSSNIKRAVIGGVAGAVIALAAWFVSGFAAELRREDRENG